MSENTSGSFLTTLSSSSAGGVEAAAKLINQVDRHTERNVFGKLEEDDNELAEKIRNLLFVFEDILTLGDRELQLVIREADQTDLALALRGAPPELREKIMANMSERGAETLRVRLRTDGSVLMEAAAQVFGMLETKQPRHGGDRCLRLRQ